jgi:hypothetical protein
MRRLLEAYRRALQQRPLAVNLATGVAVAAIGDCGLQLGLETDRPYK